MDPLLIREEPLVRKCCFVIPLKFCLQIWAVLNLGINIFAIGYIALMVMIFFMMFPRGPYNFPIVCTLFGVALLMDSGFLMAFIIGVFKVYTLSWSRDDWSTGATAFAKRGLQFNATTLT